MKRIMFILGLLMMVSSIGYAMNYTCKGNQSEFNTTLTVSSSNIPIIYNETCKFGCNPDTGRCYSVGLMDIGAVIAVPIIAFILAYLGINFKSEDWAMQILLLAISIGLLVMNMGILQRMTEIANSYTSTSLLGGYQAVMWVFVLVLFYFILKTVFSAYHVLKVRKVG